MPTIRAAVVRSKGEDFTIERLDLDEPRHNEVLVRIVSAGMCHTDLVTQEGYYTNPWPCVLGHEGAGVVEAVGTHCETIRPGDHVVLAFPYCGECRGCLEATPYCDNAWSTRWDCRRPDGSSTMRKGAEEIYGNFFGQSSFATHALAVEANVVRVSKEMPLDLLGPLGCGIQTGAGAVMNSLACGAGSSIAIFGVGSVGMAAVMAARVVGCTKIIAIDTKASRLELARELGATHVIDGSRSDAGEGIGRIVPGGVDFALEITGVTKVLQQAAYCIRPMGVCGVIGQCSPGEEVTLDPNMILIGRVIRGIIQGDSVPRLFIPRLIELYQQGRLPIDRMNAYYSLDEINMAARDSLDGTVIKPVIRMQ